MAQATRNLNLTSFAYANDDHRTEVIDFTQSDSAFLARYKDGTNYAFLYAGFSGFPASLKNNRLYSAKVVVKASGDAVSAACRVSADSFDPATLTFSNRPGSYGSEFLLSSSLSSEANYTFSQAGENLTASQRSILARNILQKLAIYFYQYQYKTNTFSSCWIYKKLLDGTSSPYIEITYDDSVKVNSKITENGCPTSGYFDPRNARKFEWTFEVNDTYYCAGAFTQQSATLYWKESTAGSWNSIAASGSTKSVTVPANTFPTGKTIQWYLAGTDTNGCASQTTVYSISTAAATLAAYPVSPSNAVIDGSEDIPLVWSLEDAPNTNGVWIGYTQTEGGALTQLYDAPTGGALTTWSIPADTLPSGQIIWAVAAYNRDGVKGTENTAQFLNVAAPAAPTGLTATPVPFTTISWQSSEQQAYKILIDGREAATGFGTAKTFSVSEPLEDGIHEIGVMVQGVYSMWSQLSTISVSIENSASGTLALTGVFDIDAALSWVSSVNNGVRYLVYRDGTLIARTEDPAYTDRMAIGVHSYAVIQQLSDGNYLKSDTIAGELSVDTVVIGLLHEEAWLQLQLSENSSRQQVFSYSRKHSLRHIAGAAYPFLEISPYTDLSGSYDCAFRSAEDAEVFENMQGKVVIMKSRDNGVITGLLATVQKAVNQFYRSYTFTIQQIHVEGFEDADA